jgi:hypothetical protein
MKELIAFRVVNNGILPHDTTFDSGLPDTEQRTFRTVSCMRPFLTTTQEQGIMLNGRKFSHILYAHKEIEVTISSDEVNSEEVLEFFEAFWKARYKYISLKYETDSWDGSKYIEVMTEGGRFPVEYIDGIADLPEITFKLFTVNPETL